LPNLFEEVMARRLEGADTKPLKDGFRK